MTLILSESQSIKLCGCHGNVASCYGSVTNSLVFESKSIHFGQMHVGFFVCFASALHAEINSGTPQTE
jgi:hypothetical protein